MPHNGSFEKKRKEKKFEFDHSLAFSCLHLLFLHKKLIKFFYNNNSLPWALAFFY
jgi:hypothetical protein